MGISDLTFVKFQLKDYKEAMKGEHIMVKLTVPKSNWEIVNGKACCSDGNTLQVIV